MTTERPSFDDEGFRQRARDATTPMAQAIEESSEEFGEVATAAFRKQLHVVTTLIDDNDAQQAAGAARTLREGIDAAGEAA